MIESNIVFFLIFRQIGVLKRRFKDKIVVLSRPNFYFDDY